MTSTPEMLIKKRIDFLCFFDFKQMFLKPCFKGPFGLSNILHSSASLAASETYERISTDGRSIVNTHSIDITTKFAVSIKEKQDRLPTLYWLPKLHKRPYKACFIVNSSSCTTTVLSKLITSCLTAVKNIGLDTMILFTKGTELTIFGQLIILMMFSINLNLKTFRLLKTFRRVSFCSCVFQSF